VFDFETAGSKDAGDADWPCAWKFRVLIFWLLFDQAKSDK
jgi:hypothetical protein